MQDPINRTILLMDIEKSGGRLDVEQGVMRRLLYGVLKETLLAASVEADEYRSEDRGDGVFVLFDAAVSKPQLIRALLHETPMKLNASNRVSSAGTQVRLRLVLHAGEVALDEHGAVGADLVAGFRLLDAAPLRRALDESSEPSVLCVSDVIYQGVVRHAHPGIYPEHFHPFVAEGKEGQLSGWLYDRSATGTGTGAGSRTSAEPAESAAHAPPAASGEEPRVRLSGPVGSGNFFFGNSPQVSGDVVAGDKNVTPAEKGGAGECRSK